MHNYVYNYIYMCTLVCIYIICVCIMCLNNIYLVYIYTYSIHVYVYVCINICVFIYIYTYISYVCAIYLLVFKDMPNFKPWSSFVPLAALALTLTYRNCSFDHVSNVSSIGILIPLDQFFTVVTLFGSPQEPSGIRASRLLRVAVRPRSARPSGIK